MRCCEGSALHVLLQQVGDEVLGVIRDLVKGLILKVPGGRGHVGQGLVVVVPHEGRETAHPGGESSVSQPGPHWSSLVWATSTVRGKG